MAETITLTKEQFDELLKGRTTAPEGLTADALAKAFTRATKPENTVGPQISPLNPKGEIAFPRPELRAKTLQNGVELDRDVLAWEEIEALNALVPGTFYVTKGNGLKIRFTVTLTRGADEESIERVDVHFPCKDEHRYDHRPLLDYCLEALEEAGKTSDVTRIKALAKELNALRKF